MAESSTFAELQAEMKQHLQTELGKFLDIMDIRDREYASRFAKLELASADRLDRIETAVESLLQKSTESAHDGSNSYSSRPPFQVRNVKLEFPWFDGKHAIEWIFKAEQFFEYYGTPDADRLTIAAVHLDQTVVPWYQMM
ncbi:hypothetical protein TSUD_39820 [Trifolium subterraneum]|uniref:Retrotransposon gag domain-containing protein n=1 Tax=Trifolium subterraneum TaxID=3900 RepID=A0A2Z6M0I7_TRISU|nr:hypothetical protein TSUD_39820 [Trifolium subterraneum]